MNIYSIYKATNKNNNKVYIGFDENWPKRKEDHYYQSNHRTRRFYSAIKHYGWDAFEWEVLYQSTDGEHCLKVMENYFITEYRSFIGFPDCNGYNMTLGGDGPLGHKHTKQQRKTISKNTKLAMARPEVKEKFVKKMVEVMNRPERKRYNSVKMKKYFSNPDNVEKTRLVTIEAMKRPEVQAKIEKYLNTYYTCPHCSRSFLKGHYNRYHGDKCKSVHPLV